MEMKKLGNSELSVSALCIGTWAMGSGNFWGKTDDTQCMYAIDAMIDRGVNIIDTAPGYNAGRSEILVGKALRGKRDRMILVTKAGVYEGPDGTPIKDGKYNSLLKQIEGSLQRLETDYVDVLLMHWPDPKTPLDESMRALAEIKKQGKARYIGVSNFTIGEMELAKQFCELSVLQHPYSMVDRTQEDRAIWSHKNGMGTMSYGSLGGGILTGFYRTLPVFSDTDARHIFYRCFDEPMFSKIIDLLKIMDRIAEAHKVTTAQVALKWNMQKPFITTAVVGVKNVQEATENCRNLDWRLNDDEEKMLDGFISENLQESL